MQRVPNLDYAAFGDVPQLDPVIYHEPTAYGWRGLTQQGEVLEVRTKGAIVVPTEMTVYAGGRPIGWRKVNKGKPVDIDLYLRRFHRVVDCYKAGRIEE